jgi:hypothetical protein
VSDLDIMNPEFWRRPEPASSNGPSVVSADQRDDDPSEALTPAAPSAPRPISRVEWAVEMARRGLHILRLAVGDQAPAAMWKQDGSREEDKPTRDEARIREMFRQYPGMNYACVPLGSFAIIDVDTRKNGEATLEALPFALPKNTFTVKTPGGGAHIYYKTDTPIRGGTDKLGKGVDVQAGTRYVVGPGSRFTDPHGKKGYTGDYIVTCDAPIAAAPESLKLACGEMRNERERDQGSVAAQDAPEDIARARHYLENDAPLAIEGQGGDAQTYKVACELRDMGMREGTALELMAEHWNVRCTPPWDSAGLAVKVANAFAYGQNSPAVKSTEAMKDEAGAPVALPASEAATAPAKRFRATVFDPTAPIDPPEHYLYGLHHVKGILTVTAAPGGYGKSQLGLAEAMCMAAGRELLGERVYEPLRVWFLSLDDPLRITRKRAVAFMRLHGLSASDFGNGRLMLDGSDTLPPSLVKVATGGRDGVKVDDATVSAFMAELKERQVDVLILDPLVKFHAVEENDNPAMNIVGETLAGIAARAGCAVETIVHTSKPKGQQITAEHVRGASSFVNAARAVRVVNPMTEDEARRLGIAEEKRLRLFRVDLSKGNLAPPSDARWFQRMPVALDNGNDRMPEGESFPAVTRYRLPDPIATTTDLDIAKALEKLAAGPDGAGSPWRASDKASGYIGVGIAEALGLDTGDPQTRATCRRLIKDWLARGLLIERRTRVKSEGRDTPFIHIPADWRERLAALAASARACAVTADEAGPGIEDPNRRT